ncbi:MAG: hypothetical protein AAF907_17355 [Planctomycetota bacterium]
MSPPLDNREPAAKPSPEAGRPKPLWRRALWAVAHLALAYHLIFLVLGPATLPPSSPTQMWLYQERRPEAGERTANDDLLRSRFLGREYQRALYLDHGYHYFAPEPGPSTLLQYEGTRPDGRVVSGVIPDADGHFPRLLYHRHFMLTERLPGMLQQEPADQQTYYAALARGLGMQTGAEELTLTVLTHRMSELEEVRAGFTLDDPATYQRRELGTFDARPLAETSQTDDGGANE